MGALAHAVAHVTALRRHDAELWQAVVRTVEGIDGGSAGSEKGAGPGNNDAGVRARPGSGSESEGQGQGGRRGGRDEEL